MKKIAAGILALLWGTAAQAGLQGNFELDGEPMTFRSVVRENPPSDAQREALKAVTSGWHMSSYDPKTMPDKTREHYEALTKSQFDDSWKAFQEGRAQLYVITSGAASDDNWHNSLKGGGFYVPMGDTLFMRYGGFEVGSASKLLPEVLRAFTNPENFSTFRRITFFLNAEKKPLHDAMIRLGCEKSYFTHHDYDSRKHTAFEKPIIASSD